VSENSRDHAGRNRRRCRDHVHESGLSEGHAHLRRDFLIAVIAQVPTKKYRRFLYWFTIVATTTVGTTMTDLADRSEGLGYAWASALLLALVRGSLGVWFWSTGTVSVAAWTHQNQRSSMGSETGLPSS
jgi:uncharacterized membrane-anchored protein